MPESTQPQLVKRRTSSERREEILQALAGMLEQSEQEKITTARLASQLEISEAALYRHFSGKAAMFDALLDFIEDSLSGLAAQIRERRDLTALAQVKMLLMVMLDFANANRGLTRVLSGHALVHESPKLSERVTKIHTRLESDIRQGLRAAVVAGELPADFNTTGRASLLMSFVLGQWLRFVLSNFRERPNQVGLSTYVCLLSV